MNYVYIFIGAFVLVMAWYMLMSFLSFLFGGRKREEDEHKEETMSDDEYHELFSKAIKHVLKVQDFTAHTLMNEFGIKQKDAEDLINKFVVMNVCNKTPHGYYTATCKTNGKLTALIARTHVFELRVISYRDITDQYVGLFDGMLYAEKDNEHDPYAVAVFKGSKHVGYIPRGNKKIWQMATESGGVLHCKGYISKNGTSYYYGEVSITL